MAHFAIRGLMHEAALEADEDPDRFSFLHAVRVIRRKMGVYGAIPPCEEGSLSHKAVLGEILQEHVVSAAIAAIFAESSAR